MIGYLLHTHKPIKNWHPILGLIVFGILLSACGQGPVDKTTAASKNRLFIGKESKNPGLISIPINPMSNLNFKSKAAVCDLRKNLVMQHPELAAEGYNPELLLANVVGGRPWWGLAGLDHYGPGMRSIEGLSDQSRFLANPFLLVGVRELYAMYHSFGPDGDDAPHLMPSKLEWRSAYATAEAKYEVGSYYDFLLAHFGDRIERKLELIAYNAHDFGFDYFWIDADKSKNIAWISDATKPVPIPQIIHCGGSCGYPDGCNSMSPPQGANMLVDVLDLPATVYVKLWRKETDSSHGQPDMTFVIELER